MYQRRFLEHKIKKYASKLRLLRHQWAGGGASIDEDDASRHSEDDDASRNSEDDDASRNSEDDDASRNSRDVSPKKKKRKLDDLDDGGDAGGRSRLQSQLYDRLITEIRGGGEYSYRELVFDIGQHACHFTVSLKQRYRCKIYVDGEKKDFGGMAFIIHNVAILPQGAGILKPTLCRLINETDLSVIKIESILSPWLLYTYKTYRERQCQYIIHNNDAYLIK